MKVLYQWALRNPPDWTEIDPHASPTAWSSLQKRARPTGVQDPGNQRGWINAVNCQGVVFEHDVYVVEPITVGGEQALRVYGINDQTEPSDRFQAHVWTFLPLAPDPAHGGRLNTRQSVVWYFAPTVYNETLANFGAAGLPPNATLRPWSEFVYPPESLRRYGVQLVEASFAAHRTRRAARGWTDWA